MKKFLFLGIVFVMAVAVFGKAGFASAQTEEPEVEAESSSCPRFGSRMGEMLGRMRGRGMMGKGNAVDSVMYRGVVHEYHQAALAEKLGLTPEQLSERFSNGDTIWLIAEEQGMTLEQYRVMLAEAHAQALSQAVSEGVISQEQADYMQERMQPHLEKGFGPGSGRGFGGFKGGRSR